MLIAVLLVLGGFAALVVGAEGLVRGSASIALRMGVSALVVGLTIVALGTSAPELAVSVAAALEGRTDLAVGNVVGSNIFNVAVILGVGACLCPLPCQAAFIKRETPIMIGVAALIPALALIGGGRASPAGAAIMRWEGVLLLVGGLAYIVMLYRIARQESAAVRAEFEQGVVREESGEETRRRPLALDIVYIAAGIGLLVLGSDVLVAGASQIARAFGVSELVIGLTIVAMGTSLPELATTVIAAIRRQPDIAVGNVVGSCIMNVLWILGCTSAIRPLPVSGEVMTRDIPVMVVLCLISWPLMATGKRISRLEGGFLLALFAAYMVWVVVSSLPGSPPA